MNELCVDASVAVKLVFKGESHRATARRLIRDCLVNKIAVIAPPFFESEVDTAVRKRVHEGRLTVSQGRKALATLDRLPVRTVKHPELRRRAREIAEQFNQRTVYDCTYTALAELRACEFWTADKQFFDAVTTALSFVKYLPNYSTNH